MHKSNLIAFCVLFSVNFFELQGQDVPITVFYSSEWKFISGYGSRKCVSIAGASTQNDAEVRIFDCMLFQKNQHWSQSAYKFLGENGEEYHYYKVRNSEKCLEIRGAEKENRGSVIQNDCATNFPLTKNQLFAKINSSQKGNYQLKDLNSGRCISVAAASTNNSAPLLTFECKDQENQQWKDFYANV